MLHEHGCGIAPNTYWAARTDRHRRVRLRDEELVVEIRRVFEANLSRLCTPTRSGPSSTRESIRVATATVERLIRAEGLSGARRGKAFTITTHADDRLAAARLISLRDRFGAGDPISSGWPT